MNALCGRWTSDVLIERTLIDDEIIWEEMLFVLKIFVFAFEVDIVEALDSVTCISYLGGCCDRVLWPPLDQRYLYETRSSLIT